MAAMMKAMGQKDIPEAKPILEINGGHELVKKLFACEDEEKIADIAIVLLDQALLVEGVKLKDSADFVKSLNRLLTNA
jgi:molecular chaperone HtpG